MSSKNLNKVLKRLQLENYAEDVEKSELIDYIKLNNFEEIKEAFLKENYSIIGEVISKNKMLSFNDILDVIVVISFYLKN